MKDFTLHITNNGRMNLSELIKKIEKRPNMFFVNPNVHDLKLYLSGFLLSRTYQDDFNECEEMFKKNFSEFVALKLSVDKGESWEKLIKSHTDSWGVFFEFYYEFEKLNT